jgi:hypothetical protein
MYRAITKKKNNVAPGSIFVKNEYSFVHTGRRICPVAFGSIVNSINLKQKII